MKSGSLKLLTRQKLHHFVEKIFYVINSDACSVQLVSSGTQNSCAKLKPVALKKVLDPCLRRWVPLVTRQPNEWNWKNIALLIERMGPDDNGMDQLTREEVRMEGGGTTQQWVENKATRGNKLKLNNDVIN